MMKEKIKDNKRHSRSYKCTDEVYVSAMDKAKEKKSSLAKEVENFVIKYSKK